MSDTTWGCSERGERYPKRATPCGQCGSMSLEGVAFAPDPEPDSAGRSRRRFLLTGAGTVVGVAGAAGAAVELAGVTDWTPVEANDDGARSGVVELPRVEPVALLVEYVHRQSFDAEDHATGSAPAGRDIRIGLRFGYRLHDQRLDIEESARTTDASETEIDGRTVHQSESYDEYTATVYCDQALPFDTEGWGAEQHTASVTVRGRITDSALEHVRTMLEVT